MTYFADVAVLTRKDLRIELRAGDTLPAIERIYQAAGFELDAAARKAMRDWEAANPPGKHGQHKYTLDHFGITDAEIRAAFGDYLQRFGRFI